MLLQSLLKLVWIVSQAGLGSQCFFDIIDVKFLLVYCFPNTVYVHSATSFFFITYVAYVSLSMIKSYIVKKERQKMKQNETNYPWVHL